MDTSSRKKRSENWTVEEKKILRHLISQSFDLIENKSNKGSVNLLKKNEWKVVTDKFNELTNKNRTDIDLRLAWKRIKMSEKTDIPMSEETSFQKPQIKTEGREKIPSPSPRNKSPENINAQKVIIKSNTEFKQKQLEMMRIEHEYNVKIAELKIKKLKLEIKLLEKENCEKNSELYTSVWIEQRK